MSSVAENNEKQLGQSGCPAGGPQQQLSRGTRAAEGLAWAGGGNQEPCARVRGRKGPEPRPCGAPLGAIRSPSPARSTTVPMFSEEAPGPGLRLSTSKPARPDGALCPQLAPGTQAADASSQTRRPSCPRTLRRAAFRLKDTQPRCNSCGRGNSRISALTLLPMGSVSSSPAQSPRRVCAWRGPGRCAASGNIEDALG